MPPMTPLLRGALAFAALLTASHTPLPAQTTAGPAQGPNGHYYEVVFDASLPVTWAKAKALASDRNGPAGTGGAHLATITDEQEDLFIESLRRQALNEAGIDPDSSAAPSLWIGGSQASSQSQADAGWTWVNGEGAIESGPTGMNYINWLPGEPNDWPTVGVEDNEEDFLAIGLRGEFFWNDAAGPLPGYVVEYERTPTIITRRAEGPDEQIFEVVIEDRRRTWAEADREARCRTWGWRAAHLATITSKEEDEIIEQLRKEAIAEAGYDLSDPDSHPALWIGGRQERDAASPAHDWHWVNRDGRVAGTVEGSGYENWLGVEPNDHGTPEEDNQQNNMTVGLRGNFGWDDAGGTAWGYVVEYEDPNGYSPPYRSSRYDGTSHYRFSHRSAFSRNIAMTVSAWVYRGDSTRTEAILSHGEIAEGFFFGFAGDKIRFGRSGGFAALSFDGVPTRQWTHVAATYDGTTVRFFIDGEDAGARTLLNAGADGFHQLRIGAAQGGGVLPFLGSIDEIRLWSRALSPQDVAGIQRYATGIETTYGSSESNQLEAVWPAGGKWEAIMGINGVASIRNNPPALQRAGVRPSDLVVPAAVGAPVFDGNVDPTTEYAGAEQMVIRYQDGPSFADATAYLVHTKEYLYLGVEGARLPAAGEPGPDNRLELYFDRDGRSPDFDEELFRTRFHLQDGTAVEQKVGERIFEHPITGQQNIIKIWEEATLTSSDYQVHQGTERAGELTTVRDVEFRIKRSLLGEFDVDSRDRIAIRHADHGGPGGESWAPERSLENGALWAYVYYSPGPGDVLPRITARGSVRNTNDTGLAGITVNLSGSTDVYATTVTNADGFFGFSNVPVGLADTLRVGIEVPVGGTAHAPELAPVDPFYRYVDPFVTGAAELIYPGCTENYCRLRPVDFRLTLPLPRTELGIFFPDSTHPPVQVRAGASPRFTRTDPVEINGTNLHRDLEFYLVRDYCPNDPTASPLCEPGVDYYRLESTFIDRPGFPPIIELRIPRPPAGTPGVRYPHSYRLAAHDIWARPANDPTSPASWRYASEQLSVTEPPYELIHGFSFENLADGHSVDDFRIVFAEQVCNPFTMVGTWAFAPIYLAALGNGDCMGMVTAANRMATGKWDTGPGSSLNLLHGDVLHGGGFPYSGASRLPDLPARFNTTNPCDVKTLNIWAQVRSHHGAQLSTEFIRDLLAHFEVGPSGLVVDHRDVLARIRPRPLDYHLCFYDGDKAHCVQPLRIIDEVRGPGGTILPNRVDIEVWDPNHAEEVKILELTIEPGQPGTFNYYEFSDPWEGNWLMAFEIDPHYDHPLSVPSLDILGEAFVTLGVNSLDAFLQLVVSGDAEPTITVPGSSVGWDGAGNFSQTGLATIPIPQANWVPGEEPPLGHHPVNFVHRLQFGTPTMKVHNRGESYLVHSAHRGNMLQAFVSGGQSGDEDTVQFGEAGGSIEQLTLVAGGRTKNVEPRVALCRDGSSYPAAISFEAMPVPAGASLGIRRLPGASGVELLNNTGASVTPLGRVTVPTSIQGGSEPEHLEIPRRRVPPGASMLVRSVDGETFDHAHVDIDLERDGIPEFSWVLFGESGDFRQVFPIAGSLFDFEVTDTTVTVSWDHLPGWNLAFSEDLERWSFVPGVAINGDRAGWSGPRLPGQSYFRLERPLP